MGAEQHFNQIAKDYDYWKNKNWYYYQNLKALYKSFIPPKNKVWEIGCGTGDILDSLEPSYGYGTDTSEEMIKMAENKYQNKQNIRFQATNLAEINEPDNYDFIIIADILEHVENLDDFFANLSRLTKLRTKIIISIINPIWEPMLMLAEKLKMKMPEGPHWRLSVSKNESIFRKNGFKITDKGYRLLIPKKLPFSDPINNLFHKNKILARFGFVTFWILEKT